MAAGQGLPSNLPSPLALPSSQPQVDISAAEEESESEDDEAGSGSDAGGEAAPRRPARRAAAAARKALKKGGLERGWLGLAPKPRLPLQGSCAWESEQTRVGGPSCAGCPGRQGQRIGEST